MIAKFSRVHCSATNSKLGFIIMAELFVCHFSLQLVLRHNSFESFLILILVIHKLNLGRGGRVIHMKVLELRQVFLE